MRLMQECRYPAAWPVPGVARRKTGVKPQMKLIPLRMR